MIRNLFAVILFLNALGGAAFAVEKDIKDVAPLAPQTPSDELGEREGFTFHINGGLDVQRWEGTNSSARITLAGGVTVDYFLSEVFGLFGSLDYSNRGASIFGSTSTATFIDLSLGVALRYRGNIFSQTSVNYLQFGGLFAFPTGDFTGAVILPSSVSKMFMGMTLHGSSVYPIGKGMFLGPTTWIKFGLGNPVSGLTNSAWFSHVGIGVQLTF